MLLLLSRPRRACWRQASSCLSAFAVWMATLRLLQPPMCRLPTSRKRESGRHVDQRLNRSAAIEFQAPSIACRLLSAGPVIRITAKLRSSLRVRHYIGNTVTRLGLVNSTPCRKHVKHHAGCLWRWSAGDKPAAEEVCVLRGAMQSRILRLPATQHSAYTADRRLQTQRNLR